jgi:hypothetical protein
MRYKLYQKLTYGTDCGDPDSEALARMMLKVHWMARSLWKRLDKALSNSQLGKADVTATR